MHTIGTEGSSTDSRWPILMNHLIKSMFAESHDEVNCRTAEARINAPESLSDS